MKLMLELKIKNYLITMIFYWSIVDTNKCIINSYRLERKWSTLVRFYSDNTKIINFKMYTVTTANLK